MKTGIRHIALYSIRIFLMVFWLYVAIDKLFALDSFKLVLLSQPLPDWSAGLLYWSLPLFESAIALLFIFPERKFRKGTVTMHSIPYLLSAGLLLIFSIYIALGLLGYYAERPCGCASVFSNLSWTWHLAMNLLLAAISLLGAYLTKGKKKENRPRPYKKPKSLFRAFFIIRSLCLFAIASVRYRRFPRRFALFPGRPVEKNNPFTVYT
ncbi:MauE/DoxX family redox-associated membrane protein [Sphingobacterium sp. LRF_L2]|uniref:MauE/DoxX family redox-associated membrane protein n=1 Tax=Sphingobacterium sp. LRF_L2 TaxID=3369421 RepID=UPI003F6414B9